MSYAVEQQEFLPHVFIERDGFAKAKVLMTQECAKQANDYLNEIGAIGLYVANVTQDMIRTNPKRRTASGFKKVKK